MTFTIESESIGHELVGKNCYYVSITQEAYSNILDVQAWKCDRYGLCEHIIYSHSYNKNDIKKAKATYRRYINKCKKL